MLRFLRIAAYLNFAAAVVYLLANLHFPFAFLLATAVFFIDGIERGKRYFKTKKVTLLIIALVSVVFNPFAAVFTFLAYSKIDVKESKKEKTLFEKMTENEKIDLMIKIGVGFILVGGIIFTVTVWNHMPNYWKLINLLLISATFFLLSNYSEYNLKIRETTILYWNLGIFFLILGFVSIGYFALFGDFFSFFGQGGHLLLIITFLILGLLSHLSYRLYNKIEYQFVLLVSILFAIHSLLVFIDMEITFRFIVLIFLTIAFALYEKKEDYFNKFTEFLAVFVFPGLFLLFAVQLGQNVAYIPLTILTVGFMLFYTKEKPDDHYLNFFTPFVTLIILSLAIAIFPYYNWQFFPYILTSIFSLAYIIILFVPFRFIIRKYLLLLINAVFAYVFFDMISSFSLTGDYDIRLKFAIASMVLLTNILNVLFDKDKIVVLENLLQPLKIIAFVTIGYAYFLSLGLFNDYLYLGHLLYTIMLAMLILSKSEFAKRIYYFSFYSIFLVMLTSSIFLPSVPIALLLTSGILLLYTYAIEDQFKDKLLYMAYLIFLITSYTQLVVNDVMLVGVTTSAFIALILFSLLMIATRKHNVYFIITAFMTLLPAHAIIMVNTESTELYLILSSMLYFYGLYLLNQLVFVEKSAKQILTPLLAAFIILIVIFTPTTIIGFYMVLIGLILIVYGYNREEYIPLYYLGVGTIGITFLYQLRIYWPVIPIWVYLLLAGILLIAFATYLETRKINKK